MKSSNFTRNAAFLVAMFAALLSAVCPVQALELSKSKQTIVKAGGFMQATVDYGFQDKVTRPLKWDSRNGKSLGTLPTGIGASLRLVANPLLEERWVLAVGAMFAPAAVEPGFDFDQRTGWKMRGEHAATFTRGADGKYTLLVPLTAEAGTDVHDIEVFVLVGDGLRKDKRWLGFINEDGELSPHCNHMSTVSYFTDLWPTWAERPTPVELATILDDAGCATPGFRFERILRARAMMAAAQAASVKAQPVSEEMGPQAGAPAPPTIAVPPTPTEENVGSPIRPTAAQIAVDMSQYATVSSVNDGFAAIERNQAKNDKALQDQAKDIADLKGEVIAIRNGIVAANLPWSWKIEGGRLNIKSDSDDVVYMVTWGQTTCAKITATEGDSEVVSGFQPLAKGDVASIKIDRNLRVTVMARSSNGTSIQTFGPKGPIGRQ